MHVVVNASGPHGSRSPPPKPRRGSSDQTGSAQLITSGNVSGFVIFRFNPNGQEAVVPLGSRNANSYLIAFDNTAGTATGLAIGTSSPQAVSRCLRFALSTVHLSVAVALAGFKSRAALQVENLALRHQLGVLHRSVKRPTLTAPDRLLWAWLCGGWSDWRSALIIVQPETVIAWHRKGFRLFWRWKIRNGQPGRPKRLAFRFRLYFTGRAPCLRAVEQDSHVRGERSDVQGR